MAYRIHLGGLTATLALCALALAPRSVEGGDPVRGITVSTPGYGREWGTDEMARCVAELDELGANWVTTHPYASVQNDGSVRFRLDRERPSASLTRPIAEAHRRKMRFMVKPHLAYWGSRFSWRGDIDFGDDDEAWHRFWNSYETWIVGVAAASKDADAFVVGTELDKTLRFTNRWRAIIEKIRAVTDAHLTYAANWTDYQNVDFWSELDCIGIQAYFPISDEPTDDGDIIRAGWATRMAELRRFSDKLDGKPIVFTELGYPRRYDAAVRPWEYRQDDPAAGVVQRRCLEIALQAIETEPRVVGAFLWKWFPRANGRDHNFKLQTPEMKALLQRLWRRTSD